MNARDTMLAAIRDAVAASPAAAAAAHGYRRHTEETAATILARFAQRLADYNVTVLHAGSETEIAPIATLQAAQRDVAALVVPDDLPRAWRPACATPDHSLTYAQLDAAPGVMTASRLAIAESGTIVLDAGPGQGRRVLTLLPDYHLCVVRAGDVVSLLPEAMLLLQPGVEAGRPLTFISGPSATADIELDRVEGVHGPRRLDVILVA